ncbi:MAG TPA: histidine kinase dimerization/phosphoacceptor domain -containing protein [Alphaproteobacteria bacterium]|nr:histidine kinase dimerization/phosphoacceptor domain -containing protein [Alphaproteobacteria bacterium]
MTTAVNRFARRLSAPAVLATGIGFMLMVLVVSVGAFVWHDREDALRDAARRTGQAARTLEEHTALSLRAVENLLDHVAERIRAGADRRELDALSRSLLQVGSIWYVDMRGDLIYTSYGEGITGNYADRDYFRYSAAHDGPHVGPLIRGRAEVGTFFTLSKRVSVDGTPVGVVLAGIEIGYWSKFHESLGLNPDSVIAVFRNDGRFIARHPPHERMFETNVSQTPFFLQARPTERAGVFYDATSSTDGITRVVAHRPVAEYGLFVIASESRATVLADWRRRAIWASALAGTVALIILGLGLLAWRLARLESDARRSLAEKARDLAHALDNAQLLHRELQHRTKNNLQLVMSLLRVGMSAQDPTEAMRAAIGRVGAISRAYADLPGDVAADRATCRNVIAETVRALTSGMREVQLDIDVADCTVPVEKAAPLALIVNEVTTNALKYGVSEDGFRHIAVRAKHEGSVLHVEIRDRGPGLPDAGLQRRSTGLQIVEALARQIDARFQLANDGGAVFKLQVGPSPGRGSAP